LAVISVGFCEPPDRRIPGSRPRGRRTGLATWARRLFSRTAWNPGPARTARDARDRTQDRSGASFRGDPPPRRAPALLPSPWPGMRSKANGLPGGAKLRSGRDGRLPASHGTRGNRSDGRRASCTSLVRSQRSQGTTVTAPQSLVQASGLTGGQRAGAMGKAVAKLPSVSRRRWSTTNPQGSSGPRERVRLLGKGKLWRAAPRNASGMKEGREASGRHGEPADLARVRACRERSQNRREGQEP
jgi:hypothetical protein